MMEEIKEKLSEFGQLITCKKVNEDVIIILITEGFSGKASNTMKALGVITESFPEHPRLEICVTDENLCLVVLTK